MCTALFLLGGCPGADLPLQLEAVYTAIAQVGALEVHNVPGHSMGFSPSASGPHRAPRAGRDTSLCAKIAVPAPLDQPPRFKWCSQGSRG